MAALFYPPQSSAMGRLSLSLRLRYALAIMSDNTSRPPQKSEEIVKMMQLRGATMVAYANFEYFLARLLYEASRLASYKNLDLSFSENADRRVLRLKSVLATDGPLSQYSADLSPSIDAVLEAAEFRNFAAHGVMIHSIEDGTSMISSLMYKMFKGGNLAEGKMRFTMDEYLHHTQMLTASVKQFVSIVRRIWADQGYSKLGSDQL
ncbi:hypothetical protein [Bradyrhizobium sp. LA7.1]|uniref:hypothetical protein n=1 Tax=Bradyrhizobium sp. LA7.1 TaxID=3156324 RepID=UPI0033974670